MKILIKYSSLYLLLLVFYSCKNELENNIIGKWSVTRMEKKENRTSNNNFSRTIEISPKMSYRFNSDNTVHVITQLGSRINGVWSLKDSTVYISVKKERKEFQIKEISENTMLMVSGDFKFYLEN